MNIGATEHHRIFFGIASRAAAFMILAAVFLACRGGTPSLQKEGVSVMPITVTSSAFKEGEFIPKKFTCDGDDVSPPISWTGIPGTAKSIALITDDPDAPRGTYVHWVCFNIPPTVTGMPEKVPTVPTLPDGTRQGINDSRQPGYTGPCPPGGTHRYYFKVYALDTLLTLQGGVTKADLLSAMSGHVIAEGQLMGRFAH